MYWQDLVKPDGRRMTLYGRVPIDPGIQAPSPFVQPLQGSAHLRWHVLRGQWVTYASFRQDHTFMPPPEFDPLAPTRDREHQTEVPSGQWEVAVFENRFPSLGRTGTACEVVVFSQDRQLDLGYETVEHIALVLRVLGDRTRRLGERPDVQYVLPFENRGAEMGVTLHHPHGQIYAYPSVPPVPARMQEVARAYYETTAQGLLAQHIEAERLARERMLYEGEEAVAFVPACARYPYETWVAPCRPTASFNDLNDAEIVDLARALKTVLQKYDGLWNRRMPYVMAWYQAPTDGEPHPESHLHAELWPAYRTRDRLKYLAGTEIAADFFAMDALPEDTARALQTVQVVLA